MYSSNYEIKFLLPKARHFVKDNVFRLATCSNKRYRENSSLDTAASEQERSKPKKTASNQLVSEVAEVAVIH